MKLTIIRWLWITAPLLAVAITSASEWPARAQMVDAPLRDVVLPIAVQWAQWVSPKSVEPASSPAAVVARGAPAALPPIDAPTPQVVAVVTSPAPHPTMITAPRPIVVAATPAPPPVVRLSSGTVLLVGDSLMGEVARGLRQGLPRSFQLVDKHRASTGLTNDGYYQWPTEVGTFSRETSPHWIVIHLGGNDAQDMVVAGRWLKFGSQAWKDQYLARSLAMIDSARAAAPTAVVAWLGLPAMRSPAFNAKMLTIAALQQEAARQRQVPYIDGRLALGQDYSKDGDAGDGRRRIWRADDGIHYSREGGYRLATAVGQQPVMGWTWGTQ